MVSNVSNSGNSGSTASSGSNPLEAVAKAAAKVAETATKAAPKAAESTPKAAPKTVAETLTKAATEVVAKQRRDSFETQSPRTRKLVELNADAPKGSASTDGKPLFQLSSKSASQPAQATGSVADFYAQESQTSAAKGPNSVTGFSIEKVENLTQTVNQKTAEVEKLNQKLSKQLSDLGPALTPTQQEAYIAQFKSDQKYEQAIQAEKEATQALVAELDKHDLREAASSVVGATRINSALQALSKTASGGDSLRLLAQLDGVQTNRGFGDKRPYKELFQSSIDQIIKDASGPAFAKELEQNGGDPAAALASMEGVYKSLKGMADLQGGLEFLNKAKAGSLEEANLLLKSFNSPASYGLATVGFLYAAAKATDGISSGNLAKAAEGLLDAGSKGTEVYLGIMSALGKSARSPGANALLKLAPGLGALASFTSLATKILNKDANLGTYTSAAGDLLATVGNIATITGIGAPAGLLLNAAGGALNVIGDWVSDRFTQAEVDADKKKMLQLLANPPPELLAKVPGLANEKVKPHLIEHFAKLDGRRFEKTVQAAGLNHAQVEELFGKYFNEVPTAKFLYLAELSKQAGVQGEDFMKLVDAMRNDGKRPGGLGLADSLERLEDFWRNNQSGTSSQQQTRMLSYLKNAIGPETIKFFQGR
jgi:hypothetical protein